MFRASPHVHSKVHSPHFILLAASPNILDSIVAVLRHSWRGCLPPLPGAHAGCTCVTGARVVDCSDVLFYCFSFWGHAVSHNFGLSLGAFVPDVRPVAQLVECDSWGTVVVRSLVPGHPDCDPTFFRGSCSWLATDGT